MDACARVGVEVSASRASGCVVVRDLARGADRELGLGGPVPLFGEYGMDMRPIAILDSRERPRPRPGRSTCRGFTLIAESLCTCRDGEALRYSLFTQTRDP
jgi:hypothetical protein